MSGLCLVKKPSLRLTGKNIKLSVSLGFLYRTITKIWKQNNSAYKKYSNNYSNAILSGNYKYEKQLIAYTNLLIKNETSIYIAKDNLIQCTLFADKLISTLIILAYSSPLVFLSIILPHYRKNLGLMVTEIAECSCLLALIEKYQIKILHDFIPFEKDSNISAYILSNKGILVNKLPSPGPLMGHNKILISNHITVSTRYHAEEIKHLSNTILFDKIINWIPELALEYVNRYDKASLPTPSLTIGFYSSASWLRKEDRASGALVSGSQEEEGFIDLLIQYVTTRPDVKLILFLHPREKRALEKSKAYFKEKLSTVKYEISDPAVESYDCFEKADVGIGIYSTVLFERLFCGFKTIFYPEYISNFPIEESPLKNICPKNGADLYSLLDASLKITTEDFFLTYKLEQYPFFGWKKPTNEKV